MPAPFIPPLDELRYWIMTNMPELATELGPMSLDGCRRRLNEMTGLSIRDVDSIDSTAPAFLEALKQLKAGQSERNPEST